MPYRLLAVVRGHILGIAEIELDGDAVGITDEDLFHGTRGNVEHAVLDACAVQPFNSGRQSFDMQRDVIQGKRVIDCSRAIFGNAHMQYWMSTGIQPHTGGVERRAIANFETQYLGIELAQTTEIPGTNIKMIEAVDTHCSYGGRQASSMVD
jgi:hypothetical protein